LFQIARELLFNVRKHAGVRQATVRLREESGFIEVHVIDRGKGFDLKEVLAEREGGFGLFSVCERLGLLGGTLETVPEEIGAHVVAKAPIVLN
jgi:signal transduction histidine kinase